MPIPKSATRPGSKFNRQGGSIFNRRRHYAALLEQEATASKKTKDAQKALDAKVSAKYMAMSEEDVKALVVDDKWLASIENDIHSELDRVSQRLTQRIKELAERYVVTLPGLSAEVEILTDKVDEHLKRMGFVWK